MSIDVIARAGSRLTDWGFALPPRRDQERGTHLLTRYHMALMAQVQQTSLCNSVHDATSRLSRLLLLLNEQGNDDAISFTQERLADMLGLRRTTALTPKAEIYSPSRHVVRCVNGSGLATRIFTLQVVRCSYSRADKPICWSSQRSYSVQGLYCLPEHRSGNHRCNREAHAPRRSSLTRLQPIISRDGVGGGEAIQGARLGGGQGGKARRASRHPLAPVPSRVSYSSAAAGILSRAPARVKECG